MFHFKMFTNRELTTFHLVMLISGIYRPLESLNKIITKQVLVHISRDWILIFAMDLIATTNSNESHVVQDEIYYYAVKQQNQTWSVVCTPLELEDPFVTYNKPSNQRKILNKQGWRGVSGEGWVDHLKVAGSQFHGKKWIHDTAETPQTSIS